MTTTVYATHALETSRHEPSRVVSRTGPEGAWLSRMRRSRKSQGPLVPRGFESASPSAPPRNRTAMRFLGRSCSQIGLRS